VQNPLTTRAQLAFDVVGDGPHVLIHIPRADDKVISQSLQLAQIKNDDIAGLLFERGGGNVFGKLTGCKCCQKFSPTGYLLKPKRKLS
jgi:hypothetical protein